MHLQLAAELELLHAQAMATPRKNPNAATRSLIEANFGCCAI